MKKRIWYKALVFFMVLTAVCGVAYVGVVTGLSWALFPRQAQGNAYQVGGVNYGNPMVGQPFSDEGHLWGRVMLPVSSAYFFAQPSNDAPTSAAFEQRIRQATSMYKEDNSQALGGRAVPVDLVTCSGSGLDPDISPASAYYQVPRIAHATGLSQQQVSNIIRMYTTPRFLGIFGEPHVNVLKANIALDAAQGLRK